MEQKSKDLTPTIIENHLIIIATLKPYNYIKHQENRHVKRHIPSSNLKVTPELKCLGRIQAL